jgi:putative peptide zinc metalloprotease protein
VIDGFLPPLREELRLLPASPNLDGSPAWLVHDPVNNRFYRIGWVDFELLLRWGRGSPRQIVAAVNAETTLNIDERELEDLLRFLSHHCLLQPLGEQAVDLLRQRAGALKPSPWKWLLHHYLFFRIPLVRPQVWLARLAAHIGWIFSPAAAITVLILSLAGIWLAARQWETFATTFIDNLTWSGAVGYAVALSGAKLLHEMGHALTATRLGVRVAHMGLAMVVMFPMLYTDTSESWKLKDPRQRLANASAGIITELALAGLATLAWGLSPDGAFRSAMFFLATTSWVLTLAINATPFMRFDGYFILADILDMPNLHERSGALARVWLRRVLLGFDDPWPEPLPRRRHNFLIAFAFLTWAYRLIVFLTIALLVYHFFFKLLGIFLMVVEISWFIARPIWSEISIWIKRRGEIKAERKKTGWLLLLIILMALLLPWQTHVEGYGWLHPEHQYNVYSPRAGRLVALPAAGRVTQGQVLFVVASPDLQIAAQRAEALAQSHARELVGLVGLPNGEERRAGVRSQFDRFQAETSLYKAEQARMILTSPFAGMLVDLDPQLAPGVWINPRQRLATIIDPSRWVVDAYISEADIGRVRTGDYARVQAHSKSIHFLNGRVSEVDTARTTVLPHAMLDAQSGGPILTLPATSTEHHAEHAPRDAIYRVRIILDQPPGVSRMSVGKVIITGEARAWLPSVFERIASVLLRESSF